MVVAPASYPLWFRIRTPIVGEPRRNLVPGWPIPEGRRCITIELDVAHVAHLDTQASYYGRSRAAYLRGLIVRDMERQGPTVAKAKA